MKREEIIENMFQNINENNVDDLDLAVYYMSVATSSIKVYVNNIEYAETKEQLLDNQRELRKSLKEFNLCFEKLNKLVKSLQKEEN